MELQNSYIFLPNPYNKKSTLLEEKDSIRIRVRKSIYSYISAIFPNNLTVKCSDNLYNCKFHSILELDSNQFTVKFIVNNVSEYTYLDILVEGIDEDHIIEALEHVHNSFLCRELQEEYISIISYDAVSEYYCNKLYPRLNRLERELRKLLFNVYVVNFGLNYFKATININFVNEIKKKVKTDGYKNTNKEVMYLKNFFYSLDYKEIEDILFSASWTEFDEKQKNDFLLRYKNLSELSDQDLRAAFLTHAPKSDWDRLFKCKIDNPSIKDMIKYIHKQRNKVAHCKLFDKENYIKCNETITTLSEEIIVAIRLTEEIDFLEKNHEHTRGAFASITQKIIDNLSIAMAPLLNHRQDLEALTDSMRKLTEALQNCYMPIDLDLSISIESLAEQLKYIVYDNQEPSDIHTELTDVDSKVEQ